MMASFSRHRVLGPALATVLWFGIAPAPFPGVTASEIVALWHQHGAAADRAAPSQREPAASAHRAAPAAPIPATDRATASR